MCDWVEGERDYSAIKITANEGTIRSYFFFTIITYFPYFTFQVEYYPT